MSKETILVVDDEEDILKLVEYNLSREGYSVIRAVSGEEAMNKAKSSSIDLILLDLMLPGVDGLEVCRRLRNEADTKHIPIIMLTAKGSDADIVVGLEIGADDYITKPFSPRVLIARVRAIMRRKGMISGVEDETSMRFQDLVIHPDRYEVLIRGEPVDLTATEFKILTLMVRVPGRVFTRDQIVDAARGRDYPVTDRSVDVHIVSLRKKLGEMGQHIGTVRGIGYRFVE